MVRKVARVKTFVTRFSLAIRLNNFPFERTKYTKASREDERRKQQCSRDSIAKKNTRKSQTFLIFVLDKLALS